MGTLGTGGHYNCSLELKMGMGLGHGNIYINNYIYVNLCQHYIL